jgi:WhiB family redox-sensing transcriptional regulator
MTEAWRDRAACEGIGLEVFFSGGPGESLGDAKKVCRGCEVQQECREYALANAPYGVWGGMSPLERKQESARRNRERRDAA